MSKYADLIIRSKEDSEKALAPARADEQKAALGLEIGKLSLSNQGKATELAALKGQYPLPTAEILALGDDLALDQRRLSQLQSLQSELFGS